MTSEREAFRKIFPEGLPEAIDNGEAPRTWQEIFQTRPVKATELAPLIDEPIPYIIPPIVAKGSLTQIQGIPKGGKSAFSLYLSLCATTGTWPQPQYLVAEKPLKVLYLAWEDPAIMTAKRLSLYGVGLGFDRKFLPERLTFLYAPDIFIERQDHTEALKAAIKELEPDIVVIDTLSQIHLLEENSASEMKIPMRNLYKVARDTNVGILYIHHTGKNSEGKNTQNKARGSGAIAAGWHILIDWGEREKGSNVNPVEIQSKYEHRWKEWDISYVVKEDEFGNIQAVRWSIDGREPVKPPKPEESYAEVIRTLIELQVKFPEGVHASDLGEALQITKRGAQKALDKMVEKKLVRFHVGKNKAQFYHLISVPPQVGTSGN